MNIITKRKSRSDEKIFIFNFVDKGERDEVFRFLDKVEEYVESQGDVCRAIKLLKNRTDDKYGTDEYRYSGMLFGAEVIDLLWWLFIYGITHS